MERMDYSFIKDNLKTIINGTRVDKTALETLFEKKEVPFILNHNIDVISSAIKFLDSVSENIFVINGFMGDGKTYITEFLLDFIPENVLIFKNSYLEAINLDDIFLSLFKDFSMYHNDKRVYLPKVETSVFSEKINAYIKYCDAPMLFVFDAFEINTRSQDAQRDILAFIDYLSHFEKVKIIICSRTFRTEDLLSNSGSVGYSLKPFTQEDVNDYLKLNGIDGSSYEKEALYKVTRGHFLMLDFSVLIMKLTGLSLNSFTNEYKKSTKNFIDFLISNVLNVSSDKFVKLLLFLSTIRHGITFDFLVMNQIASFDDLEFLIRKKIVTENYGKYYLKDYMKTEYCKNISVKSKIKVHKYIIDLYESELPKKPFERNLFLSRQTMRQEISYHLSKIDALQGEFQKSGKSSLASPKNFNYLSYSRTSSYDENANKTLEEQQNIPSVVIKQEKKETSAPKPEFPQEGLLFVNSSSKQDIQSENSLDVDSIASEEDFEKDLLSDVMDEVPDTIDDYMKIAHGYEEAYNYASAILYYKKALTYKSDPSYTEKEPILYTKLAQCHKKIQDVDSAVKAYEKVYSIYSVQNNDKANDVLLSIARMYSDIYKFDKAKEYYKRILYSSGGVSLNTVIRVYLDMAEVEDNSMDTETAIKYLQKALKEAEKSTDVKMLLECYFKYALLLDETGRTEMATKYYLRCVQTSNNPEINTFMSSAYTNLAEISMDSHNMAAAKMYYELSIEADRKQNNIEGLYYSYSKLALLYQKENPEKAYELLLKALAAAKKFDDVNYAVSVYIEIADYYLNLKNYKQALKSFLLAKRLVNPNSNEGLQIKINDKINKMKILLGDVNFMRIVDEIKKNK